MSNILDEISAIQMVNGAYETWDYVWEACINGFISDPEHVKCIIRVGSVDDETDLPDIADLECMFKVADSLNVKTKAAYDLGMLNIYAKHKGMNMTIQ